MRRNFFSYCLLTCTGIALTLPAFAQDESARDRLSGLSASVGLEYSQGDYGTPYTTKLWSIPFGLNYSTDDYSVGVSVPYLMAKSDGTITVSTRMSSRMTSSSMTSTTSQSVSGIGDVSLYAHYYLTNKNPDLSTYVTGRIKLGTADETKGLGTGGTDYSVEFSAEKTVDKNIVYGTIGFQISGDANGISYDNVLYGDVGLRNKLARQRSIGIEFNYSQAAVSGIDDYMDLTGFYTTELDKQRDVYFYLSLGLTNSAPDFGAGVNLRYSY